MLKNHGNTRSVTYNLSLCCRVWSFVSIVSATVAVVKCRKIAEVTLGTLDIKSRPTRCQKGLWLQLMCCAPFRLLSQDFRMRMMEYWRSEYQSKVGVVLRVELRGWVIKVGTYSIFKLKNLHDTSEVFILIIGINKKINQRTINKQSP